MTKYKTEIMLGLLFFLLSFLLYGIHIMIFNDFKFALSDLTAQIAYIPIYVFLTSIVIEGLLKHSEKAENIRRMNTLIGVFYSEIGNELIRMFSKYDLNISNLQAALGNAADWSSEKYRHLSNMMSEYKPEINMEIADLEKLKQLLFKKKEFMLLLMSNPNLMEHDTFTELLLSIFHLIEEFQSRGDVALFNSDDIIHIYMDIERASINITAEWVKYMLHLKKEYPYLHNLAVKTNPYIMN